MTDSQDPQQPYGNVPNQNNSQQPYGNAPYQYPPQQPYGNAPYGQPTMPYGSAGAPVEPPHYQAGYEQPYVSGVGTTTMSNQDHTLRLVAFIFNVISTVAAGVFLIPLAWMIPMTVMSWGIYKGTRANTTAFGVCDLIFLSLVGGILLLCSTKDQPTGTY